jgi:hypothetical protein
VSDVEVTREDRDAATTIYEEAYDSLMPKCSVEAIARKVAEMRIAAEARGFRAGVERAARDAIYSFGVIPAGAACPFESKCSVRTERCPTVDRPRNVQYSCQAAQMFEVDVRSLAPGAGRG